MLEVAHPEPSAFRLGSNSGIGARPGQDRRDQSNANAPSLASTYRKSRAEFRCLPGGDAGGRAGSPRVRRVPGLGSDHYN